MNEVHGSKNRTALHLAAQKGRDRIAEILVKHGADVNKGKCVNWPQRHEFWDHFSRFEYNFQAIHSNGHPCMWQLEITKME